VSPGWRCGLDEIRRKLTSGDGLMPLKIAGRGLPDPVRETLFECIDWDNIPVYSINGRRYAFAQDVVSAFEDGIARFLNRKEGSRPLNLGGMPGKWTR
jgi:hypothetical protein